MQHQVKSDPRHILAHILAHSRSLWLGEKTLRTFFTPPRRPAPSLYKRSCLDLGLSPHLSELLLTTNIINQPHTTVTNQPHASTEMAKTANSPKEKKRPKQKKQKQRSGSEAETADRVVTGRVEKKLRFPFKATLSS